MSRCNNATEIVCLSVPQLGAKTETMKMEKVPWDVGWNGIVMGVGLGVRGRKRGRRKHVFRRCAVYVDYFSGIRQGELQSDCVMFLGVSG